MTLIGISETKAIGLQDIYNTQSQFAIIDYTWPQLSRLISFVEVKTAISRACKFEPTAFYYFYDKINVQLDNSISFFLNNIFIPNFIMILFNKKHLFLSFVFIK